MIIAVHILYLYSHFICIFLNGPQIDNYKIAMKIATSASRTTKENSHDKTETMESENLYR